MFNHLRRIAVFSAQLPALVKMKEIIEKNLHQVPEDEGTVFNIGFVGNRITGELATPMTDNQGYHFTLRTDQKKIPPDVLMQALGSKVAEIEKQEDRKVGRKELLIIKDEVVDHLLKKAFWHTTHAHCFYSEKHQRLYISNCPDPVVQQVINKLIMSIGELQTSTLHLCDVKHGTTTRMQNHLDKLAESDPFDIEAGGVQTDAFGVLQPAGKIKLQKFCDPKEGDPHKKASFDVADLAHQHKEIHSLITEGYQVLSLELDAPSLCTFTLNHKLKISGIQFHNEEQALEQLAEENPDGVDGAFVWRTRATLRLLCCNHITETLLEMFKPEDLDEQQAA